MELREKLSRHFEESVLVDASAELVFSYADIGECAGRYVRKMVCETND